MPTTRQSKYTPEFEAYMREVQAHNEQVRRGVRVNRPDQGHPRFSQDAENKRMGIPPQTQSFFATPGTIASRREVLRQVPPEPPATGPVWGFHEPTLKASEGLGAFLGKAGEFASDPRNAWIGLGPMSIFGRAGRLFRSAPKPSPDMGGFRVSTKAMQQASPDVLPSGPSLTGDLANERQWRQGYIDHVTGLNQYVDNFNVRDPRSIEHLANLENVNPGLGHDIERTAVGKMQLADLLRRMRSDVPGGGMNPPNEVREQFGFRGGQ